MMFMWIIPLVLLLVFLAPGTLQNRRDLSLGLLALFGLPLLGWLLMAGAWGGMMGFGWYGSWSWLSTVATVLVLGGVVAIGIGLWRGTETPDQEMHTLRLRLARGEITVQEYDELRHRLNG